MTIEIDYTNDASIRRLVDGLEADLAAWKNRASDLKYDKRVLARAKEELTKELASDRDTYQEALQANVEIVKRLEAELADYKGREVRLLVTSTRLRMEREEARDKALELTKYARHKRGCKIKPDNDIMRALNPKGEPFVPIPCSCGFTKAIEALRTASKDSKDSKDSKEGK